MGLVHEQQQDEQRMMSELEYSVDQLLKFGVGSDGVIRLLNRAVIAMQAGELPGGATANIELDRFRDEPNFETDVILNFFLAVRNFPDLSQILVHSMLVPTQLEKQQEFNAQSQ